MHIKDFAAIYAEGEKFCRSEIASIEFETLKRGALLKKRISIYLESFSRVECKTGVSQMVVFPQT